MDKKMTVDELVAQVETDDLKQRIATLGFAKYEIKVAVRAEANPDLRLVEPQVSLSLPLPETVSELRTFERSLHFKYLKEEGGRVIGTTYVLAEKRNATPLGLVDAEMGGRIMEASTRLVEAVKWLPGKLPLEHPYWQDKPVTELIRDGQLYQELDAKYGGIATRVKPGPDPRTMEEVIEIVNEWKHWQALDYTQQMYCDFKG